MISIVLSISPVTFMLLLIFACMLYFAYEMMTDPSMVLAKSIDMVIFGFLFVLCLVYLQTNYSIEDMFRQNILQKGLSTILKELDTMNSVYFFLLALLLIYSFTFIFSLTSAIPVSLWIARDVLWFFFLLCVINEIMKKVVDYSLFASLNSLLMNGSSTADKEKKTKETEENKYKNARGEVFHIGNQLYSYKEADEICRLANDSRLATREEMINAYKQGANWEGSFGWCTDQQAYTISKEKGVEGGRVKQTDLLLGVNCIGKKPSMTDRDKMLMNMIRAEAKGLDIMSQMKFLFAELNPNAFMTIRPFNFDQWSSENKLSGEEEKSTGGEDTKEDRLQNRLNNIESEMTSRGIGIKKS